MSQRSLSFGYVSGRETEPAWSDIQCVQPLGSYPARRTAAPNGPRGSHQAMSGIERGRTLSLGALPFTVTFTEVSAVTRHYSVVPRSVRATAAVRELT